MNLKDKILLKIHLFLKMKYSNLFFDLLRNINLIIKEDEKHKKKKIFKNILSEKEKKNIYSCFHKILKSMIQKEKFLNYTFSHLEFSYLKNKAKIYFKKLHLLSIEVKKKTDIIIEYYIKLCKIEIKKINQEQIKIVEPIIEKSINKNIFSVRNRGLVLEKKVKFEKKIIKKKIEDEEDFGFEIENNNNDKNKIIKKISYNKIENIITIEETEDDKTNEDISKIQEKQNKPSIQILNSFELEYKKNNNDEKIIKKVIEIPYLIIIDKSNLIKEELKNISPKKKPKKKYIYNKHDSTKIDIKEKKNQSNLENIELEYYFDNNPKENTYNLQNVILIRKKPIIIETLSDTE